MRFRGCYVLCYFILIIKFVLEFVFINVVEMLDYFSWMKYIY